MTLEEIDNREFNFRVRSEAYASAYNIYTDSNGWNLPSNGKSHVEKLIEISEQIEKYFTKK